MSAEELERTKRYYERFAETYEHERGGRGRYHDLVDDLEVELAAQYVKGVDVLEVGCGTGLVLRRIAPIARRAVGIDLSPAMLERARKRGLDVREASADELPFEDASFDVALSFKTLPHVPDLSRALSEMARVVRPGGVLIAELYNPRSARAFIKRWLPPGRVGSGTERDVLCRYHDRGQLDRALPRGCSVERIRGVRTVLPAAVFLDIPLLGSILDHGERALADHPFAARFGGFVSYVIRRGV